MIDWMFFFELLIENEVMYVYEKRSEMLESFFLVIEFILCVNEDINRDMKV